MKTIAIKYHPQDEEIFVYRTDHLIEIMDEWLRPDEKHLDYYDDEAAQMSREDES